MSAVVCPCCVSIVPTPEGGHAGPCVACSTCGHEFRVGDRARPADLSACRYWEEARVDDMPATAGAVEGRTAPPPAPAPAPTAPRSPRSGLVGVASGALGLGAGLAIALAVALSSRGRPGHEVVLEHPAGPAAPAAVAPQDPPSPAAAPAVATPDRPPAALPTAVALPKAPPPAAQSPPWSFDRWLQDFDRARRQARDEGKDVLLLFDSSDWSEYSQALAREVFARPDLWRGLTEHFVPVHIDFPEYPRASRRVQDPRRNEALQARFFKHPAYPRVVLSDADGRPYACEMGYEEGSAERYVAKLESYRQKREDRDELLAAVAGAAGKAKMPAAEAALRFLANEIEELIDRDDGTYVLSLAEFYGPLLKEWRALADAHDPENAAGYRERFFYADWHRRCARVLADDEAEAAALRALAEEFDTWPGGCRFRDVDLAADLLLSQARLRRRLDDPRGAERAIRAALALKPSAEWRETLEEELPAATVSLGTGFAVARGYVLTNHHVVSGDGRVRVRVAGQEPVACQIVARDEDSDLALLKVELPAGTALRPLPVAPQAPAGRGTEVMALGYALGAGALKFTRGAVSAQVEDPEGGRRLVLDQRVNPGNSGGPLCDACGNVLGVVTAKTTLSARVDSYGIAVPAAAVDRFLRRHLPEEDYMPARPRRQRLDWTEADRQVSPSVVLVIKEDS
jgi:thioredoxin-related protein